jgi:transposase InsO family protein
LQKKRRASKPFKTSSKENDKYPNLLVNLKPISSNLVWATDFTYLKFKNKFFHLATFIDIYSQKIVGFNISDKHDTELILRAFREAVKKENTSPEIIHSDQGSEYCGEEYYRTLKEKILKYL